VKLTVGLRLRSQVGTTEAIIIRAPSGDVTLTCGGQPMILSGGSPQEGLPPAETAQSETPIGKRYSDTGPSIELLVTKAGSGEFALNGDRLRLKEAKPLPASD
jgi:hypothetical protein